MGVNVPFGLVVVMEVLDMGMERVRHWKARKFALTRAVRLRWGMVSNCFSGGMDNCFRQIDF